MTTTRVLSALLLVLGVAMVARTLALGGGQGLLLGALFAALGAGRLFLSRGQA